MATVENKGITGDTVDHKFCTPNRTNAGTPVGNVTPEYAGEVVVDTTNAKVWRAVGLTNADWMPVDTSI